MPCVSLLKRKPGAVTPKMSPPGWCQEVLHKAVAGVPRLHGPAPPRRDHYDHLHSYLPGTAANVQYQSAPTGSVRAAHTGCPELIGIVR